MYRCRMPCLAMIRRIICSHFDRIIEMAREGRMREWVNCLENNEGALSKVSRTLGNPKASSISRLNTVNTMDDQAAQCF